MDSWLKHLPAWIWQQHQLNTTAYYFFAIVVSLLMLYSLSSFGSVRSEKDCAAHAASIVQLPVCQPDVFSFHCCQNIFYISIWSWVPFFRGLWRIFLGFDRHCIESVDCFEWDCLLYYVNSTYLRAWEIFPFSGLVFNFFLQRRKALVIQVFQLFVRVTQRYFMLFVAIVMGDVSLISFSAHLSSV